MFVDLFEHLLRKRYDLEVETNVSQEHIVDCKRGLGSTWKEAKNIEGGLGVPTMTSRSSVWIEANST
jgi:hypothetical protein